MKLKNFLTILPLAVATAVTSAETHTVEHKDKPASFNFSTEVSHGGKGRDAGKCV